MSASISIIKNASIADSSITIQDVVDHYKAWMAANFESDLSKPVNGFTEGKYPSEIFRRHEDYTPLSNLLSLIRDQPNLAQRDMHRLSEAIKRALFLDAHTLTPIIANRAFPLSMDLLTIDTKSEPWLKIFRCQREGLQNFRKRAMFFAGHCIINDSTFIHLAPLTTVVLQNFFSPKITRSVIIYLLHYFHRAINFAFLSQATNNDHWSEPYTNEERDLAQGVWNTLHAKCLRMVVNSWYYCIDHVGEGVKAEVGGESRADGGSNWEKWMEGKERKGVGWKGVTGKNVGFPVSRRLATGASESFVAAGENGTKLPSYVPVEDWPVYPSGGTQRGPGGAAVMQGMKTPATKTEESDDGLASFYQPTPVRATPRKRATLTGRKRTCAEVDNNEVGHSEPNDNLTANSSPQNNRATLRSVSAKFRGSVAHKFAGPLPSNSFEAIARQRLQMLAKRAIAGEEVAHHDRLSHPVDSKSMFNSLQHGVAPNTSTSQPTLRPMRNYEDEDIVSQDENADIFSLPPLYSPTMTSELERLRKEGEGMFHGRSNDAQSDTAGFMNPRLTFQSFNTNAYPDNQLKRLNVTRNESSSIDTNRDKASLLTTEDAHSVFQPTTYVTPARIMPQQSAFKLPPPSNFENTAYQRGTYGQSTPSPMLPTPRYPSFLINETSRLQNTFSTTDSHLRLYAPTDHSGDRTPTNGDDIERMRQIGRQSYSVEDTAGLGFGSHIQPMKTLTSPFRPPPPASAPSRPILPLPRRSTAANRPMDQDPLMGAWDPRFPWEPNGRQEP